jgi:hypothetical protein
MNLWVAQMSDLVARLSEIQQKLNAPKNQFNSFGKYNYRSCEDIMEGLKPLISGLVVTVTDDIVMVGDRIYVKATASITDGSSTINNSAFAREALTKKGMDESQITGTASSYARKYALNGLFLIDDSKDADSMNNQAQSKIDPKKAAKVYWALSPEDQQQRWPTYTQEEQNAIIAATPKETS